MEKVTLKTIAYKERFWFGNTKFQKREDSVDYPELVNCQIDKQNAFVYISEASLVEREL